MDMESLAGFQASVDARDSTSVLRVEAALKAAKDSLMGEDKILFLKCAGGTCPKPLSELLAEWGFERIAMIPASKTLCFAKARAVGGTKASSSVRISRHTSIRENLVAVDSLLRRNTAYARLRNVMLDVRGRRPASLRGRKLQKLLLDPEQFLMDASNPMLSSAGLNAYRQLIRYAGYRSKEVTALDLPKRTLLVCVGAYAKLDMEVLAACSAGLALRTELVLIVAAAHAASISKLLPALSCPRVRIYVMSDCGAEQMLRYGLARSYATNVAVVAAPLQCEPADIDRVFSMVSREHDHVFDSKSCLIAARREAWRDFLLEQRNDPMFQVGVDALLGKLGSVPSGSLEVTWGTEELVGFARYPGVDPSHPFDASPGPPVVTCLDRTLKGAVAEHSLVTVIMTVYNAAKTVSSAIDSVLAQTHRNLELIVIDDCSSDESLRVLQEKAASDERVRVLQTARNSGTYYAKNVGLRFARGTFVTFHDSDDVSSLNRVELQCRSLASDPKAIGNYTRYQRLSETGQEVWHGGNSNRAGYITLMVDRVAAMESVGYFDSVRVSADAEYVERLRIRTGRHVHLLPVVSYYALQAQGSLTTAGVGAFVMDAEGRFSLPPVRETYREAARRWHEKIYEGSSSAYMPFPLSARPFHAPPEIRPER